METIAKIRRYHFVERLEMKTISGRLGISRNTVRKVIRSGTTEHCYMQEHRPLPRLGDYVSRLKEFMEEDWGRPRKNEA